MFIFSNEHHKYIILIVEPFEAILKIANSRDKEIIWNKTKIQLEFVSYKNPTVCSRAKCQ